MSEFNTARSLVSGASIGQGPTATAASTPGATPVSGNVPPVEKSFLRRLLTGTLLASDPSTEAAQVATPQESLFSWFAQKAYDSLKSILGFCGIDPETSPTWKALVGLGESAANAISSMWDACVKAIVGHRTLIYERQHILVVPLASAPAPMLFQSHSSADSTWIKPVKEEETARKKLVQAFEQAMQEYAEAVRREEREDSQDKAQLVKEREDAIREAKQIIRQIDQLNGSDPDNPLVRHILASLEAPGVNLASAIEMVKQLQLAEAELA